MKSLMCVLLLLFAFSGAPRVKGPSVDLGCYECDSGFILFVK